MADHLIANYHTHTTRCHHAAGTDREYVEAAIEAGIKILGFADHSPYPGVSPMLHGMRVALDQTDDYFDSVLSLKKEYAGQIELHVGFEAEYFPELFDGLMDYLKDYPYEYLILGQHFGTSDKGPYFGRPTTDPAELELYVNGVVAGIQTGRFIYVAHPDVINFVGDPDIARTQYLRICETAKANNVPLEVNILGLRDHRHYPRMAFYEVAQQVGNTLIMGVDAHAPAQFTEPGVFDNCIQWARQLNLPLLESIPLHR